MDDAFDDLLSLEETHYQRGFEDGAAEADRKSYVDGVVFGVEKGKEKGVAMGILRGRAMVWSMRMPKEQELRDGEEGKEAAISPEVADVEMLNGASDEPVSITAQTDTDLVCGNQALETAIASLDRLEQPVSAAALGKGAPTHQLLEATSEYRSALDCTLQIAQLLPPLPANPRLRKHIDALLALTDPSTLDHGNSDVAVEEWDDRFRRAEAKVKVIEKIIKEPRNPSTGDSREDQQTRKQRTGVAKAARRTDNIEDF